MPPHSAALDDFANRPLESSGKASGFAVSSFTQQVCALVLLVCGCVLAWGGGAWGLGGAALAAAGAALWFAASHRACNSRVCGLGAGTAGHERDRNHSNALNGPTAPTGPTGPTAPPATAAPSAAGGGRVGAEVMVQAVVPVWSRQMEVTRESAADGLAQLLNAFVEISGALQTLTGELTDRALSADPGAVDQAVQNESPALQALTAASQRAFDERDAAFACLGRCTEGLQSLGDLSKRARELARHTRLVAFNASIEANRNRTQADGASQAVATEARMLAGRMADTGDEIQRVVHGLLKTMQGVQRNGEVHSTSPDELRIEIDLLARKALSALMGSLGNALHQSSTVQLAGQTLKDQLDAAFVNFQFGDRVSQMLCVVSNDMDNFAQWVAANPRATQSDAAEWLAALESSYTMDEQRSSHHGNVHVQQNSGVEYF